VPAASGYLGLSSPPDYSQEEPNTKRAYDCLERTFVDFGNECVFALRKPGSRMSRDPVSPRHLRSGGLRTRSAVPRWFHEIHLREAAPEHFLYRRIIQGPAIGSHPSHLSPPFGNRGRTMVSGRARMAHCAGRGRRVSNRGSRRMAASLLRRWHSDHATR
jgi:hypothetical protein